VSPAGVVIDHQTSGGHMLSNISRTASRIAAAAATVSLITLSAAGPSGAYTEGDTSVRKPSTTGTYTYGVFGPNEATFPQIGGTYVDPVFGSTVRRITNDFPKASRSDIYSKNGFWSADGRLMYHHSTTETQTIVHTRTGASVVVPGDYKGFDGSFAPNDAPGGPYTWYHFLDNRLMKYTISMAPDGKSLAVGDPTLVKNFGATVGGLGGSVDWIDNSGQYMVLNIGGIVKVWDGVALYSGAPQVDANEVVARGGWIGMSPDGKYVVISTDDGSGTGGSSQYISYAIEHTGRAVRAGKLFWTLCGGHGDLVSAADGQTYLVTFDCYGSAFAEHEGMLPAIYAVDVNPPAAVWPGHDPASPVDEDGRNAQRGANRKLFEVAWGDDGHFSGVSKGALRDWAFVSIESGDDTFGRAVAPAKRNPDWWTRPYMQEIVMVNVVSGRVLRVAHHRSRSVFDSYFYQPRVSATWGDCAGVSAGWASNFGQLQKNKQGRLSTRPYADYADIYAVDVAAAHVLSGPATGCLP
jgi:hypothetical protein